MAEGRFTQAFVDRIVQCGNWLVGRLAAGERWWDERWASWEPDPTWRAARLPGGWDRVPTQVR